MSYLVLARKSRPQTFSQVVGQRHVVKTLQNSLQRDRVAHAILFSGVRGVGKTTLARIMAKAINCQAEKNTRPCNECGPCREITAGSALDLIEIDGASNRGIQEIRELKEKIKFMPTSCRYKIIIIDEVHMLTTEAFNALLKTLEEPPKHVHFMFATTEIHKIPITILSRCQQYELKRIPAQELSDHFSKLALAEGVELDPPALSLIVRESEGSVRDGLSLLDQMFSYGEKTISVADVTEVLGLVNREVLVRLVSSLLAGDKATCLAALKEIFDFGMDIRRFSTDLLECFRSLLLLKIDGCRDMLDLPDNDIAELSAIAADHTGQTLHMQLNMLMQMVEDVRYSSQPRLAIETGLLKVIEAGNVIPVTEILGKLGTLLPESEAAGGASPSPAAAQQVDKKKIEQVATPGTSTAPPPEPVPPPHQNNRQDLVPPPPEPAVPTAPGEEPPPPEPPPAEVSGKPLTIQPHEKDIRKHWPDFIEYVKDRRVWMAQVLNRADAVKEIKNQLHLHYSDAAECSLLRQRENKTELTEFVLDFFQKELTVQFILPQEEESSDENGSESPRQKRHQLANDPLTIMAAEIFNGQVGDIRVGPRSR